MSILKFGKATKKRRFIDIFINELSFKKGAKSIFRKQIGKTIAFDTLKELKAWFYNFELKEAKKVSVQLGSDKINF